MRLDGTMVDNGRRTASACVVLEGDRIAYSGPAADLPPDLAARARVPHGWDRDVLLIPGLVDLHHHGGAGGEYGPDPHAARRAAAHHRGHGSTSLIASLVANAPDALDAGVAACSALVAAGELKGVRLEGPFLSPVRRGAQNPAALIDVDLALVERLAATAAAAGAPGALTQMTFAPERPGAEGLPRVLARHGIVGAVGHTDATERQTRAALDAIVGGAPGPSGPAGGAPDTVGRATRDGRAIASHVFNAMRPMRHRDPGPIAACLSAAARGEAVLEVIGDGAHLDAGTVRMLFDLVGPGAIALVSDAVSACGMPPGRYTLGDLDIVVDDEVCRLADDGALAGSVATLLDVLRWVTTRVGVPLEDAVTAATATPARVAGLPVGLAAEPAGPAGPTGTRAGTVAVGSLAAGARADVIAVSAEAYDPRTGRVSPLVLRAVYRRGLRC